MRGVAYGRRVVRDLVVYAKHANWNWWSRPGYGKSHAAHVGSSRTLCGKRVRLLAALDDDPRLILTGTYDEVCVKCQDVAVSALG